MGESTDHSQVKQFAEGIAEETESIDEVKDLGNLFLLRITGGEQEAKRVATAIETNDALEDGYDVETVIDPETDEPDVRIVSDSLKQVEERVSENLREFVDEYC